jgi:hypothetical protein
MWLHPKHPDKPKSTCCPLCNVAMYNKKIQINIIEQYNIQER